ncbi:degenerate transposase [Streptococcus pneumoniae]|nr:degenerate transposase [Streptococcus pneumoniae]
MTSFSVLSQVSFPFSKRLYNIQNPRHLKATEAGEFVTIDALFQAYKKELGRSYTRDAFYQLLKRHGWRNIMPRPEHPKKADAQTIVASKNKISIQEDKKAF